MGRADATHSINDFLPMPSPRAATLGSFCGEGDSAGAGLWHGELGDSRVSAWENAWIDLGGEG